MSRVRSAAFVAAAFLVYAYGQANWHHLRALLPTMGAQAHEEAGNEAPLKRPAPLLAPTMRYQAAGYFAVAMAQPLSDRQYLIVYLDQYFVGHTVVFGDYCNPSPGRVLFVEWAAYGNYWPESDHVARCGMPQ